MEDAPNTIFIREVGEPIEAMLITETNGAEVARWCNGAVDVEGAVWFFAVRTSTTSHAPQFKVAAVGDYICRASEYTDGFYYISGKRIGDGFELVTN